MTVDEIASEVGCSRATFYVHFPGKLEILEAISAEATSVMSSCEDLDRTLARRALNMSLSGSQSPIAALLIRWSSLRTISTAQSVSSPARW
ncbi:helix-turn-helix domain containing protein (plasmid) [Prescottella equi]|uniref:TetR/AcrR family transcriptional regulator n=1 Tax=Rhodococcus hoagii TaxID=43767 RepID=UPI002574CEA7|nr:TetR/AcrR family transcriptional regulator [Prescottella equi]WJJ14576.1 helix-turn-helix domain containing protein [Prescottella equi]